MLFALMLVFLSSFLTTYAIIPFLIPHLVEKGLVGRDMNKYSKPKVAELGGIATTFGFISGISVAIFLSTYLDLIELNLELLFAAFSTILIISFIGILDDLLGWKKGLKKWQHVLFPLFASLPLMVVKVDNPPMVLPFIGKMPSELYIPFVGFVSFSIVYSLILVPIGITGASNATNMLAGLNGLEAGTMAIIFATLAVFCFHFMQNEALVIAVSMLGSFLAFLRYNWYPAKIFGGDALTLSGGAAIASIAIVGNMERIGVSLLFLHFIELLLKARSKFKAESFGIPTKRGYLKAPKRIASLTHVVMFLGKNKLTEKEVVLILLVLQLIVSLTVLMIFL